MGWRTIVVNQHSKLNYKNNHLVYKTSTQTEMIHLSEVDILIAETTDINITTMLLKRLVDYRVLVIFCDDYRLPASMLQPFYGSHDSSLQLKQQIDWSIDKKEYTWTKIIEQKIMNQAEFLASIDYKKQSEKILKLVDSLEVLDPTNREGHAARMYFNTLYGNDFSRKYTDNDINAALNYGYTLILSVFAREIVKTGCLTQFGLKHANQFNQFNLASDIMEPFRVLVDRIVYQNRNRSFDGMKRQLFNLFHDTYPYGSQNMYLTNIASDYTKKIIKVLNGEITDVPEFRL